MSKLERQPLVGKYRNYSTYSNSGVDWIGEMPAVWTLKRVKHMFTIRKRIAGELGYDILSVTQRGIVVKDIESGEGQLSMDYSKYQRVKPGDFAMNHMDLLTGYVDISDYDGVTSPDYRVFTLDNTDYFAKYFLYIFQMGYQLRLFFHMGQGASHLGRWRLATDEFNEMVFPVPSCEEQRTIAAFLDYETARIDRLITQQQRLIELLKEKRQAVISHAVTKGLNPNAPMRDSGIEWLGQVPKHWDVSRLKFESDVIDCRNKTPEYFDNGEYFVVRTTNVKNQQLNFNNALYTDKNNFEIWTQRGVPVAGSILFTREAPTGEVCIVPENVKLCMGQRMMNFICSREIYTSYLFDYLISACLERYINSVSHGSTVSHLRVEQVENIPVLVPPEEELVAIHEHIRILKKQYDILETKVLKAIELMQERRTALISAAVTGKIDLRGWTPPAEEAAA
ncbi:restriction endonuclease subunit S [Aeromonas dhakensis]|uniref:restriction endonuclease subunit S n=1 Tax=Aeromonas TaxID=642 RepID=UPI001C5BFAD1|nr:restriction endonuclease subunit S [Aeromonas hydrophila]